MTHRVVSLIPSATEIVGGLVDASVLVGVTHECDHPDWVRELPKIVAPADPTILAADPADVDQRVSSSIGAGQSLYAIDERLMQQLQPDVVITQGLCAVCAAPPDVVQHSIRSLAPAPCVVELSPMTLEDVIEDIGRVGAALGCLAAAERWQRELRERLAVVQKLPPMVPPPKVLALEWTDPLWIGGHWVPEMIRIAGGVPVGGMPGQPSTRIEWETVRLAKPDIVLIMACGYDLARNAAELPRLQQLPGWSDLPAVQNQQIFAVDANAHFSRSGPRLIDGVELLADVFRNGSPARLELAESKRKRAIAAIA